MSWSECFKLRAVADHYRSIVLGLSCPLVLVDAGPHLFQRFAVVLAVCSLWLQPGEAIEQIPTQSKPAVFLHRALGSYVEWAEYAQLVGGHANFGGSVGPGVPNTQLFHGVFSHPIFKTRVRRSLLWSTGNLKGGPQ